MAKQNLNEKEISEKLKKECVFYEVLWRRFDKKTGGLIQDDYLDKKYATLHSAISAVSRKPKEGVLIRTTWTIIGCKKERDHFIRCCTWNEEKKILERV